MKSFVLLVFFAVAIAALFFAFQSPFFQGVVSYSGSPSSNAPSASNLSPSSATSSLNSAQVNPLTSPSVSSVPNPSGEISQIELLVHEKINAERAKAGLPALQWDAALAAIARRHSEDMAVRNFFSHVNPDGKRSFDRARDAGYFCPTGLGENIQYNYNSRPQTPEEVASIAVDWWMNSEGHRNNILRAKYHNEGIGVAKAANKYYLTQVFC